MTEVASNLEPMVVENGGINVDINGGEVNLAISVETQGETTSEEVVVNGVKENGVSEEEEEAPPLQDDSSPKNHMVSGKVRKSSMERLLEETHNTMADPNSETFYERKSSYSSQGSIGSSSDNNNTDCNSNKPKRKTSIYEQKQVKAPSIGRGNFIASRTENLFKNYERDISQHEPRPMININEDIDVSQLKSSEEVEEKTIDVVRAEKERELLEIKKLYQQRLIEEEKERADARRNKKEDKLNTTVVCEENGDIHLERSTSSPSSSGRASVSSTASVDEDATTAAPRQRRTSVYEQKQIEAPSSTRGSVIASRTENLFKQYQKDLTAPACKPMIDLTEGAEVSVGESNDSNSVEQRVELKEIKNQYQRSLSQDFEGDMSRRTSDNDLKNRKSKGSHMNRYIALTRGESVQHSSDEEEDAQDGVDESLYVDKHGVKIERSGGKIEIVKSSDSISSIKNIFGGTASWKKSEAENPSADVDPTKVKSALNVFKDKEVKKPETGTFNRPKSKKVRDPKELMEIRKKATYGEEEELPQDGVVTKSVVIEKEELDTTIKHHALNVYKNLEKKEDTNLPVQKPKTKLISDTEAQATMEGIRTISSSNSEASDVNETVNDLTVDTVSGYGSAAPCSPSSTLSEDYLSDHKDVSPREELKDPTLNLDVSSDLSIDDDISLVKCQSEISTSDIPNGNPIETVDV